MALCDTQHAGKEIVTRSKSEYFANDPECHDLLPCALQSHRVAVLGGCPTGPPVGGVTSTSTPALCGPVPFAVTGLLGLLTKQCELRTPCGTLRTARCTRVTSRPISGRVRMLVRILPVRQFAVRKLPNPVRACARRISPSVKKTRIKPIDGRFSALYGCITMNCK